MRRESKMREVRRWLSMAPAAALKWLLGAIAADLLVRVLEPEIALVAGAIRALLGL